MIKITKHKISQEIFYDFFSTSNSKEVNRLEMLE